MNKERHNNAEDESGVESKVVTVSSNQGHKALMIVAIMLLIGGVYYLYFSPFNKESPEVVKKEKVRQNIQELKGKLEQVPDDVIMSERMIIDPLLSLPPLSIPQAIPEVKRIKKEEVTKKEEQLKETPVSNISTLPRQNFPSGNVISNLPTSFPTIGSGGYPRERRSAQMLTISGGNGEDKATDAILSNTSTQSGKATRIGKLGLMITQGKVIDVILETAINSDLQGVLRAVVSRDIYAETGDTILIPKGSRLVGGYSFDSNVARARVNINWNRIILPYGIDVAIASPGTDELGRAGIAGIVDNKIASALFSSVALAGISIGSAMIEQKASNFIDSLTAMDTVKSIVATEIDVSPLKDKFGENGSKADNNKLKLGLETIGRIQNAKNEQDLLKIMKEEIVNVLKSSGVDGAKDIISNDIGITLEDVNQLLKQIQKKIKSVYESAIKKSINDFSKDMRDVVGRYTDKKPIVYVDQGTALKVFVNQDIDFSTGNS
ncbi:MAG: TrbI/VirB10 family protein [Wolbachia sp.]